MLEKQYSVQFFTSLVESMQKVCREYLQFDQAVELSGYLSLEIDNTKRERYVVSEMLQNTGNVISESYCTKAFKTLPSVAAKKPDSSREVLRELSERLHDQPYLTSPAGADPRNIQGYSRQLASRSGSGSGQDTPSFSNQHRARTNNSFPHTDVSQDHHEQFSYLPADWDSPSVHPHGASLGVGVSHIPPSVSNSCDRLALPTVKRRTMQILPTTEPKKGKLSSGEPHTEVLSSGDGHGEGLSPVFSNSQHNNEQSVYCTNSDSQPSLTNSLSHTNSLHNTCNIKTERDSSVHFVQVDSLEDSNGLSDVSEEQFRTLTMGNTKSTHENLQLQSTQMNPGIWDTGDPSHEVELFKASQILNPEEELVEKYAAVKVNRSGLVEAEMRAVHSRDPPSALLNLVIDLLFSPTELANSTGLGMKPRRREYDQQRPLDALKVDAVREYVRLVCKQNGCPQLLAKEINRKFTNKCSHARHCKNIHGSHSNI